MLSRYKEFIICFTLLLVDFTAGLSAENREGNKNSLPDFVTDIQFLSSDREWPVDSIKNLPETSFKKLDRYSMEPNEIVWLRILVDNRFAKCDEYMIHFYGHLDEVYLYQENEKGEWAEGRSGVMVPEKLKTVKGFIKDKVPFFISEGDKTLIYLKIKNRIVKHLDTSRIRIIDSKSFNRTFNRTKQVQSFFLGIVAILCFFNLLLYVLSRIRIYLYYMLYATFSSIYFIHFFQYFESGYWVNHPQINIYLFFSTTFIPLVYSWFLYESLKPNISGRILTNMRKYALVVSVFSMVILVIAVFDFSTGVVVSDVFSIGNSIIIVLLVLFLYRRVSSTVKIILSGSLFLVAGAFSTVVLNFKNEIPLHVYFFQAGFFIELIFFTIAINFMYQNERLEKIKAELKNTVLENEKLNKEREAQKLHEQVQLKERDLATKAVVISQKENLIKNVSSQLEKKVQENSVKIKDIKDVVSNLNSKINNGFWEEFESHFIKVHPDFYKLLNTKYPGLTTTERRLCAFIKLNLTTKEIAGITKRNPESIHMTRSRLRKKMGLYKSENLENIISAIG
jgi:hypothetical protein